MGAMTYRTAAHRDQQGVQPLLVPLTQQGDDLPLLHTVSLPSLLLDHTRYPEKSHVF